MTTSPVRLPVLAVGLLLALVPAARAETQNPYLSAGIQLYSDLEPESALEQLKKAQTFGQNTPADDVQISMYIGLVKMDLGDSKGAEIDFKMALALDSAVQLPKNVSPRIRTVFERVRKDTLATRKIKVPTSVATTDAKTGGEQGIGTTGSQPGGPGGKPNGNEVKPVGNTPPTSGNPVVVNTKVGPDVVDRLPQQPGFTTVATNDGTTTPPVLEKRSKSYLVPITLLGVGLVAGGVGGYFGMQSSQSIDQAKSAQFQSEAVGPLDSARSQAMTANVMYGAAAVSAVAGIVTLLVNAAGE